MDNDMYERLVVAMVQVADDNEDFLETMVRYYAWSFSEKKAKEFLDEED